MSPVLVLAAILRLVPAAAGHGPPKAAELQGVIRSLIRDLGAERYDVRERATEALQRIGQPAISMLEKAAKTDDPEVRIRARQILNDVHLGIRPDWPPDITLLIRHYDRLPENERYQILQRLAAAVGTKAVPFLVQRIGQGSAREGAYAYRVLTRINEEDAWQQVITLIKKPKNDHQARALGWAQAQKGQALDALRTLAEAQIKDATRDKIIEAGVEEVLASLRQRKFRNAAATARQFARDAPDDARFLYLRAEALIALDSDAEALPLRKRAIALNPDKEAPHYAAGQLLGKLGRRRLAAREWQKILQIDPKDGVYDINAHIRLSTIYTASRLYGKAADHLSTALEQFVKAREAGRGMGILGGNVENLQAKIKNLREKAARSPAAPGATIRDAIAENGISVAIAVTVKDGKLDELRKTLATVDGRLTVAVKPAGLRIFDVADASLRYDKDKKQVVVLLNDAPCCKPFPVDAKDKPDPKFAVSNCDCTYILKIDPATGRGRKLERFEKDYVVTFRPGLKLSAWADVAVKVNGKAHEWAELLKGIPLDQLPESFTIALEGTAPSGDRKTSRTTVKPIEPEIKPPPPPRPPPKPTRARRVPVRIEIGPRGPIRRIEPIPKPPPDF